MTSPALAAHATRAATPPFNSTFYATIVPVMFLALRRGEFVEATPEQVAAWQAWCASRAGQG